VKYVVTVSGRTFDVGITENGVLLNGTPVEASLTAVPDSPLRHLLTDRASRTYAMRRRPEGWVVERAGEAWIAQVTDERSRELERFREKRAGRDAPGLVRAPMPGLVLRVEVAVGQQVPAGGGLVVLEAMKMENEIRSPSPGTVRAVLVQAGQAVDKGAPLVEVQTETRNPQSEMAPEG
jgi:pyruvate carboxylase subunit B